MFVPLLSDAGSYNLSLQLFPKVIQLAEGIAKIGIGIGAIMLLIVVIYYVISILDGGKFQLKMLTPLLMFFVVCNFSWVAKPVLQFTTTMTKSLVERLTDLRKDILNPDGFDDIATIGDHYIKHGLEDDATNPENRKDEEEQSQSDVQGNEASPTVANANAKDFSDRLINGAVDKVTEKAAIDFATTDDPEVLKKKTSESLSFSGILCRIINWICSGVGYCLRIFGIMMTSIVVGFGPITFAFAIMPGRGANIVSWFIRICQFALYAPLCSFLDAFTACAYSLLQSETEVGWLAVFGIMLANLVALTSVPTIASMVIEGASGAVSLSQGLQTITGAATMAGGALTATTVGRNNALGNFMMGMNHKGLVGFGKDLYNNHKSGGENGQRMSFGGAFMKTMKDITKYGSGGVYGWNLQEGTQGQGTKPEPKNPEPDNPGGNPGGPANP